LEPEVSLNYDHTVWRFIIILVEELFWKSRYVSAITNFLEGLVLYLLMNGDIGQPLEIETRHNYNHTCLKVCDWTC